MAVEIGMGWEDQLVLLIYLESRDQKFKVKAKVNHEGVFVVLTVRVSVIPTVPAKTSAAPSTAV